ncbi:MAG: hypothetical protein R3A13_11015 [Bdellovibrionota bacterium]
MKNKILKVMLGVALLIPTVYVVPLSLTASNARSDLVVAAELDALIKEIPKGSLFISREPRQITGIHYLWAVKKTKSKFFSGQPRPAY